MFSAVLALLLLGQAPETKPNFVFMFSDDQRYDALGVVQREQGDSGRFPWFQTPNMDRIANEGIRFRNAFVVTALCSPSRACFLTGQYGHKNGIINNRTPFPQQATTYASVLGQAGYATGYVGKFHMGTQSGQRPTFGYSASFVGQGKYQDCPVEVNGIKQETKGWIDDVSTDFALDFIRKNRKVPFALTLGFKAPHGPFTPPERHKNSFQGKLARKTPNFDFPPPFPTNRTVFPKLDGPEVPVSIPYFGSIAGVDDNVGRVLKALDEHGLTRNTVVIYSSDNGYYHGEHGLGDKRSAYEESIRIPLLVRCPSLTDKPGTRDAMALNIDLAPTILDIAGVPIPASMQGKSWKPLLQGKQTTLRDSFFYEYFRENPFFTPTITAVRTPNAKLVKYPGNEGWNQLFDLTKDPFETSNLIKSPEATQLLARLEAEYERLAREVDYKAPAMQDKPEVPPTRIQGMVLDFRADPIESAKIKDHSKHNNTGKSFGVGLVDTDRKTKAFSFDGKSRIDIAKSHSLDPSGQPFRMEVSLRADSKQGTILARGGASIGYCLHLMDGKVALAINTLDKTVLITAPESIQGKWVRISAGIDLSKAAYIEIDGVKVASKNLGQFLPRDPSDILQVAADTGSPVLENRGGGHFTGLIESLRLIHGVSNK